MNKTSLALIPLSPEWLSSYRQIAVDTFRQTFDRHNSPENMLAYISTAYDPVLLEKDLDQNRSAVFLARLNGQTVGYLKLNFPGAFTHPVDQAGIEVERIYVDAACQGQGVGQVLMAKAIAVAESRKARFIWLGVWEQNEKAKAFYEKKGFIVFGSHSFLLGNDKQTDLLMRLDLPPALPGGIIAPPA